MIFNIKYFLKNILNNPIEGYLEFIEDYKKDNKYKDIINDKEKIWICGLPKSGTTLIEQILDFLPLSTVDYSGGLIISDWYSDGNANESIKITIRFLDNEVRSENLKISVHQKVCKINNCNVSLLSQNKISNELKTTIIRKAALLEKNSKKKK